MLDSILFFLHALAYSIYVLFLSFGIIVIIMLLMAGIITIAEMVDKEKENASKQ